MRGAFVAPWTVARNLRAIAREDVLPLRRYAEVRKDAYLHGIRLSKQRRLFLGPVGTIDFFSYDSIWIQVHEMLYAETIRGQEPSEEQIEDELEAYNCMLPQGDNVPFTLFFEIDNEVRRRELLSQLARVEQEIVLDVGGGGNMVPARDLQSDIEEYKTDSDGKASAVHFLSFDGLRAQDVVAGTTIACKHPAYPHSVRIHDELLAELKKQLNKQQ